MTSILNNIAANTALMNLENTVSSLQSVQNEISTGLKVSSAADNASYFSIASVLRSDSSALSSVSDQLNLGNSSLSVASTALGQIQTTLSDIKQRLVDATTPGADRTVIQQQISQDQLELQNIANSASFNGQNFLSVNSNTPGYNPTKDFVASYSRDSAGAISLGYISVNTNNSVLFDTGDGISTEESTSTTAPTLPTGESLSGGIVAAPTASYSNGQATFTTYTQGANGNYYSNVISLNGTESTSGTAPTISVSTGTDQATLNTGDVVGGVAGGANAPTYDASTDTLTFQIAENSPTTSGDYNYQTVTVTGWKPSQGVLNTADSTTVGTYTDTAGNTTTTAAGTGVSIFNMNIASLTDSASDMATLNAYQQQVDAAISSVATAASTLGTAQSRIQAQTSFVSSLQTSINNGVGSLVDADLDQASTRLQALQVQQQLGVQSLSIANNSTQAILKLFQ
jgi:flagellin